MPFQNCREESPPCAGEAAGQSPFPSDLSGSAASSLAGDAGSQVVRTSNQWSPMASQVTPDNPASERTSGEDGSYQSPGEVEARETIPITLPVSTGYCVQNLNRSTSLGYGPPYKYSDLGKETPYLEANSWQGSPRFLENSAPSLFPLLSSGDRYLVGYFFQTLAPWVRPSIVNRDSNLDH